MKRRVTRGEKNGTTVEAGAPHPWREEALGRFLTVASVLLPVIVIVATVLRGPPVVDGTMMILWGAAAVFLVLRLTPRVPFRVAAWSSIAIIYVPALSVVPRLGVLPGPAVAAVCASVLAAIYFGRLAAYALLAGTIVIYLLTGYLMAWHHISVPRVHDIDPLVFRNWVRITVGFGIIAGFLTTTVHFLVSHLERHYESALRAALQIRGADARWRLCAEQLMALGRSGAVESGDLDAAFRSICEAGVRALGVERCSVWLLDDTGRTLRCQNLYERTPARHSSGVELSVEDAPTYFAALGEERVFAAAAAKRDPRTAELRAAYLVPLGIESMLDAPIHDRDRLVGVVCHEQVGQPISWPPEAQSFAGSIADFAARALLAAERAAKDQDLRVAYQQVGQLNRRLESAKEEERRFLAHELHDELGQTLTALKIRFQMLARSGGDPADAGRHTREAVGLVDGLIGRVRKISLDLRPPLLDEVGLASALRAYVDSQASHAGIPMTLAVTGLDRRLAPEIEMACYRVVQEAITNVLRHAGASAVEVRVEESAGAVDIAVRDDGRGFVPAEVLERVGAGSHLGLIGMRERARSFGGELKLSSRPGGGTSVSVRLPLPAA
jgi:signal transduction histidine kinase